MRKIEPKFETTAEFKKDVQVTYDENYINYLLFTWFQDDKPFSITEALIKLMPENFDIAGIAIKALMNTSILE